MHTLTGRLQVFKPWHAGAHVHVAQQGVDVVTGLFAPDGRKLAHCDSPSSTRGVEVCRTVAAVGGSYEIRVRPLYRGHGSGRYHVRIAPPRESCGRSRRCPEVSQGRARTGGEASAAARGWAPRTSPAPALFRGAFTSDALRAARDAFDLAKHAIRRARFVSGRKRDAIRRARPTSKTALEAIRRARPVSGRKWGAIRRARSMSGRALCRRSRTPARRASAASVAARRNSCTVSRDLTDQADDADTLPLRRISVGRRTGSQAD